VTPTDAVVVPIAIDYGRQPEVFEEFSVEGATRFEVADREHDVRDAVDFHVTSSHLLD
jgi:hypothetical protein